MVGLLLSAQQQVTKILHGGEQIRYIRGLITSAYTDIRDMKAMQGDNISIPREPLQFDRLKHFIEDLENAVDHRMSSVGYKRQHELRSVLLEIDKLANLFEKAKKQNQLPMSVYNNVFRGMKNLSWLGLTDKHLDVPKAAGGG